MTTRIYKTSISEQAYNDNGNLTDEIYTEEFDIIHIFADEGKIFVEKSTGERLTNHIQLGTEDSADNYEEVDA